tara:strand:- start:831 stop:998 length:168 start_codon:yes stop_codon:yes gene_type:complete
MNKKYKVINSFKTYSYVLIEAENEKQAKTKAKTEALEWLDLKGEETSKIESVELC